MACDMIESCLQRTEQSFQQWLKKSVTFISTDYIISTEMCAMVNVILDAKNQSFKLCSVDGIDVVSYCSAFDSTNSSRETKFFSLIKKFSFVSQLGVDIDCNPKIIRMRSGEKVFPLTTLKYLQWRWKTLLNCEYFSFLLCFWFPVCLFMVYDLMHTEQQQINYKFLSSLTLNVRSPKPSFSRHNHYNKQHSLAKSIFFFILSFVKHQYHAKIDDQIDKALASMTQGLINKLVSVLEATLGKLGRYDEGSLIGSLLSFTVISKNIFGKVLTNFSQF